jgi:hypothetical protein
MRSWRSAGKRCELVGELIVRVECYAGYKGDERPVRLHFREKALEIVETEDRWYAPGATFFVCSRAATGTAPTLEAQDVELGRVPGNAVDTKISKAYSQPRAKLARRTMRAMRDAGA